MKLMKSALAALVGGVVICSATAMIADDPNRVMDWPAIRIGDVQIMGFGDTDQAVDKAEPAPVSPVEEVQDVSGHHHSSSNNPEDYDWDHISHVSISLAAGEITLRRGDHFAMDSAGFG